MAFGLVDGVSFIAASSGTVTFVFGSSRASFLTLAQANTNGVLADGQTVSYLAQDSLSAPTQREWGHGTYSLAGNSVARTTPLGGTAGVATLVSFTVPPVVSLTALAEDILFGPPLTLALGTITTNINALTITGTWNNGSTQFDAPLFMNIVNTASNSASLLADFQIGGSTRFSVNVGGDIFMSDGSNSATMHMLGGTRWSVNAPIVSTGGYVQGTGFHFDVSNGDLALYRDGGSGLSAISGGGATALRVYNTTDQKDTGTAPTNYERGVFDWTTTANTLTIGAQKGGTGTLRAVYVSGDTLTLESINNDGILKCFGTETARFRNSEFRVSLNVLSLTGNADCAITRVATRVLGIVGASFAPGASDGWLNYAGQTRVTSDFTVTSSTALTNVTGLSVSVQAGRTYAFEAELYVTDAAAGGVQAAIAGTATATAIQYTGYTIADNAIKGKTNATALATAVGSTTTTETAGIVVRISGTITVNAAGTLTVQMAQNTSNGTATTAKRGSYFIVQDMP
jgi:hypothetical protein